MLLRGTRGTHHAADPEVNGPRHYSFFSLQEPSSCCKADRRFVRRNRARLHTPKA